MKKISTLLLALCFGGMAFGQISTFPYFTDFEADALCLTGCGAACPLSNAWTNDLTDDLDWLTDNNGTSTTGTGPTANGGGDHTTMASGGRYMFVETSCSGQGYPTKIANLESPWFDLTGTSTNMAFTFWHHAYGATQGPLSVETRTGNLDPWTAFMGPFTDDLDAWQERSACLPTGLLTEDSVQFRFTYTSGTTFTGDVAIDDIELAPVNPFDVGVIAINPPGGCALGTNEVLNITITNFGDDLPTSTMIPVSYSVNGGIPVTETITLTAPLIGKCTGAGTTNFTFATPIDMTTFGTYTFMAWTELVGDPILSNDTFMTSTNSLPLAATPYFENFENGPAGWTVNNTANGSWAFGTPAKSVIIGACSGDSAFVTSLTNDYNLSEDSWVLGPCLDISAATGNEVVAMQAWWDSETSWDGANLWSTYDGGATWNIVGALNDPMNWYNDNTINGNPGGSQVGWTGDGTNGSGGYVCVQHSLDSLTLVSQNSVQFRVNFGSDGSVTRNGFAFDDFAFGIPPTYSAPVDSVVACDTAALLDAGPGWTKYRWSTGETTQTILAPAAGFYTITVIDSMGLCASDSIYAEVLGFRNPDLNDTTRCDGDTLWLHGNGGSNVTYLWNNGATTDSTFYTAPGPITLIKTDTNSGCSSIDSITFMFNVKVSIADLVVCANDTAVLDATVPNATYSWSTGETSSIIMTDTAGTWSLTATDSLIGCTSMDSVTVGIAPLPMPNLGLDATECDSIVLDAGVYTTYDWSTGGNAQMETVFTSGTIDLTVTDSNGCINSDTINITINDSPIVDLGPDDSFCVYLTYLLDAGNPGYTYDWSTFETTQTIVVNGATVAMGANNYSVTVTAPNGCSTTDMIVLTVDSCLSVPEALTGVEVNLFPNPTSDELHIAITDNNPSDLRLHLIDLEGRTILSRTLSNTGNTYTETLYLGGLSKGVYFIKLENESGALMRKVVVQ